MTSLAVEGILGGVNFEKNWPLLESILMLRESFLIMNQMPKNPSLTVTEDVYDTVVDVLGAPRLYGFDLIKEK